MAELVDRVSLRLRPLVPTGNGFCMLLFRHVLDKIGAFDIEHFPIGYGEENDFCMRATEAGFVHLVDDATFIFHHHSRSFGLRRFVLKWQGRRKMRQLHPTYEKAVARWLADDPLDSLRARIKSAVQGGLQAVEKPGFKSP
jgi:GT2 family glycosyltransferase